jgi:hypothetical protein
MMLQRYAVRRIAAALAAAAVTVVAGDFASSITDQNPTPPGGHQADAAPGQRA